MTEQLKTIGPSFHSELESAGLSGFPFVWRESGEFLFSDDMTGAQRAAVQAIYDAHDPEAPAPPIVPPVVSRFQGREAMHRTAHGTGSLFEAAEAVLADPGTPAMYRRAWDDLQEFRRDSEILAAIASMLGLTTAQIDALFILAADIKA